MPNTYSEYQGQPSSEKIVLVSMEASYRLVGWEVFSGSVYSVSFDKSQKIVSIADSGVLLTEVGSVGAVIANTWYFDRDAMVLYLRTSDSVNPNGKFISATFKLFFSNVPVRKPHDLSTGFDVEWIGQVESTSDFGFELDNQNQFGLALEGSGNIVLKNDHNFWDDRYDKLTFSNQRCFIYSWTRTLPITEAKLIYRGRIQGKSWSQDKVRFELKDFLNELRSPVGLSDLSEIVGARLPDALMDAKQRLIYGYVFGHRPTNYDQTLSLYPMTGTASITVGSATVTGVGTQFLKEASPDDRIQVGSNLNLFTVKTVDSDTSITLTSNVTGSGQSGATINIKGSLPKRWQNRLFKVAGHALREPTTTVVSASNATQFEIASTLDLLAGDIVTINGEEREIENVSTNNIIRLTGPLTTIPLIGDTVTRRAITNVYLDDELLTVTRDYAYSATAGTLELEETAEFNVAARRGGSGNMTMTAGSRSVTGSGTSFKADLKPHDWVVLNGESTYFEILSIESDTALTLRVAPSTPSTLSTSPKTASWFYKHPNYYKEGDTILTCDALGATSDGTTSGNLLKTAADIIEDLLDRAGLSDFINTTTFDESAEDAPQRIGIVVPEKYSDRKIPSHRDVIGKINQSVFGALVQNEDFELDYFILSPSREDTATVFQLSDILSFSIENSAEDVIRSVNVNYLPKEYDYLLEAESTLIEVATNEDGEFLAQSTKELSFQTRLVDMQDAINYAHRLAFIFGSNAGILKFKSKLQAARLQIGDRIEVNHPKTFIRLGSTDRRKVGLVKFAKRNASSSNIEIDDLSNTFNRVAVITENTANDFDSASQREHLYNGYITDTYGMIDNEAETFGINLIW